MSKRLRIYIAGPYTAEEEDRREMNTKRAIDAGIEILRKGHVPFIPHLTHYVDRRTKQLGKKLGWTDYINWDMSWLELCDGLLYLGKSKGAELELRRAQTLGKKIFLSLQEIPELVKGEKITLRASSKRK